MMHLKKILYTVLLIFTAGLASCREKKAEAADEYYLNPVFTQSDNFTPYFHDGTYYFLSGRGEKLWLYVTEDPTRAEQCEPVMLFDVREQAGLMHIWHPYISCVEGKWYIHFSGDTGNTDDHQIYVLENENPDPREGQFVFKGRVSTDPQDNWAIHSYFFRHEGQMYMVWSGWESRRVFAETQCIYIARMENPWTLSSERVLISTPQYEWERQWIQPEGFRPSYPVYVNEAPYFFCTGDTDRAYIYYSASAMWAPYTAIGELSAEKGSDLLDPRSWSKNSEPVFSRDLSAGILGPGYPRILPSPDGSEYYLFYRASDAERPHRKVIWMQQIQISEDGKPVLGEPSPVGIPLKKPSGVIKL